MNDENIVMTADNLHSIILHVVCATLDISNRFFIENKKYDVTETIYKMEDFALNFIKECNEKD